MTNQDTRLEIELAVRGVIAESLAIPLQQVDAHIPV